MFVAILEIITGIVLLILITFAIRYKRYYEESKIANIAYGISITVLLIMFCILLSKNWNPFTIPLLGIIIAFYIAFLDDHCFLKNEDRTFFMFWVMFFFSIFAFIVAYSYYGRKLLIQVILNQKE